MQSFKKKIVSLINNGIDPLSVGYDNFKKTDIEVEKLAEERSLDCSNCENFTDEPIGFLKVKDEKIPLISNKMCDECGCTLSYKLRQSIIKCDKWLK